MAKKPLWEQRFHLLVQEISFDERWSLQELGRSAKEAKGNELNTQERVNLENQLNEMIKSKYNFINYNGIRDSHLNTLTKQNTINPFDNSVVIVDEAHNFVSRIVNKLKNTIE